MISFYKFGITSHCAENFNTSMGTRTKLQFLLIYYLILLIDNGTSFNWTGSVIIYNMSYKLEDRVKIKT